MKHAPFVKCVDVVHPENGEVVELEVHLDPTTGALFAVESSFLDQVDNTITCPYQISGGIMELLCEDPPDDYREEDDHV